MAETAARPLNKVGKVVAEDGTIFDGGQLVVRPDGLQAIIRFQGGEVRARDGVVSAGPSDPVGRLRSWRVEFDNGDTWQVTERATRYGCASCGGRR